MGAGDLAGELGQGDDGVRRGVAHADDEGGASGEPLPVGAEDVGQRADEEALVRGVALAEGGQAGGAERVRVPPTCPTRR